MAYKIRSVNLTHTTSGHFKFWRAEGPIFRQTASGSHYEVETGWGRIGTTGQSLTKHFPTTFSAHAYIASMVEKKKSGGYVVKVDNSWDASPPDQSAPINAPKPFVPPSKTFAPPSPPVVAKPAVPPPPPPPPPSDLDVFDFMIF